MSHEENIHVEHDVHTDAPKKSNVFVRGAIIVAIILVLLFIALAIVKFVPKLISSIGTANVSFSSLFSPKDKMTVTAPTEVKNGGAFTVSWKNNTEDTAGSLMWSYKCASGVTVEYSSIGGQRPVICETLFPLPTTTDSYSFVAKNSNNTNTPITMTVALWDADMKTVKIQGNAVMTVLSGSTTSTPTNDYNPNYNATTTTNTNTNTNTTNTGTNSNTSTNTNYNNTVVNGKADLNVSLVKVGRISNDGSYINTNSFAENDRVTVQFNVTNIGNARSGTWNLRADLPTKTSSERVYISNAQPALNPGDSFLMTISFDAFDPNGRNIVITINASDTNQSNNVLNIAVSSNGNTSNNNGGNNNYNSTGSRADLVIRIIDVGLLGNNNQFYYSNSLDENDEIAVKFEVQNIGEKSTGSWRFTADLPTENNDTYRSGSQQSLAPGETRQFTIGFDNPEVGSNEVVIEVDSDDDIDENKENNNTDSEDVDVDD